jgi:hypothetical protein
VRRRDGQISEFVTLTEVATYLRRQFGQETYNSLVSDIATAFARPHRTVSATRAAASPAVALDHH